MPENKIGVIPDFGYNPNRKSSIKARLWIRYYSFKNNIKVLYTENGNEKSIGPYKLDGFYIANETCFGLEFHGCLYHGCPKCYTSDTFNPILQLPMHKVYERHCRRIDYIKSKINLIELWECEWDLMLKNDTELNNFVKNELIKPISARDALFGGRTNAFKLYHNCTNNEIIKYIDYTSFYPFVQKYCDYPSGHPDIITTNFRNDVDGYYGLIKCIVLPPKNLRFPVLPAKINNKLVFTLCYKCAVIKSNCCNHDEEERQLKGTWCSIELSEALKFNYKIKRLIEVWHFNEKTCYNPTTKSGGLFTSYMNEFLKLKQEASGWPSHIKTNHQKTEYIQSYFENEGIHLNEDEINENNGLRATMKTLLNSLWGRFGMRSNRCKMKLITEPQEWFSFLSQNQYQIKYVNYSNDDLIQVFYSDNENLHQSSNKCNVVIAAFVTAHARIRLFREMIKLDDRLLYCDTDSLIYISRQGHYEPLLGDYLGQFKDETDGDPIIEFVSAGPKNRAHVTASGRQECIVKGFSLNYIASLRVNFQSMKEIVLFERDRKISVEQMKIIRNINDWTLDTIKVDKEYGLTYDKRILFDDLTTLPFRYKTN